MKYSFPQLSYRITVLQKNRQRFLSFIHLFNVLYTLSGPHLKVILTLDTAKKVQLYFLLFVCHVVHKHDRQDKRQQTGTSWVRRNAWHRMKQIKTNKKIAGLQCRGMYVGGGRGSPSCRSRHRGETEQNKCTVKRSFLIQIQPLAFPVFSTFLVECLKEKFKRSIVYISWTIFFPFLDCWRCLTLPFPCYCFLLAASSICSK